jgi:hypothetical protein
MGCLHPVLTTVPQGAWHCPRCRVSGLSCTHCQRQKDSETCEKLSYYIVVFASRQLSF